MTSIQTNNRSSSAAIRSTSTAGGELVTIEEFTEAAIDAGLDKDIIADCLEELRVLWKEREEEEAA